MGRRLFLTAVSVVVGIHIIIGFFAVLDDGYFVLGLFAPERFLLHLLRNDGSRFTVSGSVSYYLDDICVQECDKCEFLCYPKDNLRIVCNDVKCGLESNGKGILESGESPYFIAKEGLIFENAAFLCNRTAGFCTISTEIANDVFYDIRFPEEVPFYSD